MKKYFIIILLLPFLLLAQTTVFDHDFEDAPTSYSDDGNNDENAWTATVGSPSVELSNGSLLYHDSTTGWDGGNCAKFYPHNNGRCGFEEFPTGSWTRMNMRFMVYFNTGFNANRGAEEIKWTITFLGGTRVWISIRQTGNFGCGTDSEICLNYNETLFGVHGCTDATCGSYPWNTVPNGECTAGWTNYQNNPFKIADYEGEWICMEWETKNDGEMTIYIWTQDEVYADEYLKTTVGVSDTPGSFDCTWINDNAGNNSDLVYWLWDDMKIVVNGSAPIGTPSGFLDAASPPGNIVIVNSAGTIEKVNSAGTIE